MLNIRNVKAREWALEEDGAFDRSAEGFSDAWRAFVAGTGQLSAVPCKPGCVPSVFQIRVLSRKEYLRVSGEPGTSKINEAVAYGLTGWKGYRDDVTPARVKDSFGDRLTEACLDAIFQPEVFGSLALAILALSDLGPSSEQA